MAAGMKDVASLAGVAVGTVSNVLNHPDLVRPLTRARVEAAMEELGFIPNGSARQLRAGRSRCLGLVVLDVTNPFFTEVARGVEDYAQSAGYAVILCNSDEAHDKERSYLRVLEEQRVRGILITPVHGRSPELRRIRGLLRGLNQTGLSVPGDLAVVGYDDIEFAADAAVPLTSVRQPKYQLGRAAAELLLDEADRPAEHEHRRVVFTPELVVRASSGSTRTVHAGIALSGQVRNAAAI